LQNIAEYLSLSKEFLIRKKTAGNEFDRSDVFVGKGLFGCERGNPPSFLYCDKLRFLNFCVIKILTLVFNVL